MRILRDIRNLLHPRNLIKPRNWLNLALFSLIGVVTVQLVRLSPDTASIDKLYELQNTVSDAEERYADLRRDMDNARICSAVAQATNSRLIQNIVDLERLLIDGGVLNAGDTFSEEMLDTPDLTLNSGEVLENCKINTISPTGLVVHFEDGIRQIPFRELPPAFVAFLGIQ